MTAESTPNYEPNQAAGTEERRGTEREPSSASISVVLDSQTLQGSADNVSHAGVLFFSPESLRVTVNIEENGETRTLSGRVARVERMSSENSGYAIEFEPV